MNGFGMVSQASRAAAPRSEEPKETPSHGTGTEINMSYLRRNPPQPPEDKTDPII